MIRCQFSVWIMCILNPELLEGLGMAYGEFGKALTSGPHFRPALRGLGDGSFREIRMSAQRCHHLDFRSNQPHKFLNPMAGIGLAMRDKQSQLFQKSDILGN